MRADAMLDKGDLDGYAGHDEPEQRTEPVVGEIAEIGEFMVEVLPPSRENLPPQNVIKNSRGNFVTMAVNGWTGPPYRVLPSPQAQRL